jgi:hypothetical protein
MIIAIQRFSLLFAVRFLEGFERIMDILFLTRPYIPFGLASLVFGFIAGFFVLRF